MFELASMIARQTRLRREIRAPHYTTRHLAGALPEFRADALGLFERIASLGDVVHFRLAWMNAFHVREPDAIKRILVDNARNYGKQTVGYDKMRVFMGNGLVTSEGDFWRRQRRIAQPAFHKQRLAEFAATMTRMAEDLAEEWEVKAKAGEVIDLSDEMMKITLRIVASTVLSLDVGRDEKSVGADVGTLLEFFADSVSRVIPIHEKLPTRQGRKYRAAMTRLDSMVYDLIRARRRSGGDHGDVASMFMNTVDADTGERMTDEQLRDEIMTMFLAGHETTSNGLAWAWWLLTENPEPFRKMEEELDRVLPSPRAVTLEDLPSLTYTTQVIEEGMRLRPPVWLIARSVTEDDVLAGERVPGGTVVFFSPWVVQRHPALWDDPLVFRPERFAPEASEGRHRYAYFPFSGGPRMCIGDAFARMEAKIILGTLARRFRVVPAGPAPVPDPSVTLRMLHGFRCRLERR